MRIDKFLKVSRIIKRRTVAKDILEQERIYINDKLVKPSKEVNINDVVKIVFGNKIVTIKVLSINEYASKNDAHLMYEILSEEKLENEEY